MSKRFGERQRRNKHGKLADHSSPLRKIVGYREEVIGHHDTLGPIMIQREVLECGHVVRIKEDMFGQTNATRRRCKKCADEFNNPLTKGKEK